MTAATKSFRRVCFAGLVQAGIGLVLAPAAALAVEPPPLRVIARADLDALEADKTVSSIALPGTAGYQTAALGRHSLYGSRTTTATKVQKQVGATSAIYGGDYTEIVPANHSPSTAPPLPDVADFYAFKDTEDASQVWATMSDQGRPYLLARAVGKGTVRATSSWTARHTVSTLSDVYVQFTVPAMVVNSTFEQDGPSRFQTRLRVDLLAAGFPAWSSETLFWNEIDIDTDDATGAIVGKELARRRQVWKSSLGLPATKDAQGNHASTEKRITVFLGRFPTTKPVDLTFIIQADVQNDRACEEADDGENFCTVTSIKAEWNPTALVPVLLVKPAS